MSSLSIEVLSDRLVIRDPCSGSSVTYRRGFERGARIADGLLRHDPSQAELSFLAAAWKAAYAEAKAFGWLWHYEYWASGPTQRPYGTPRANMTASVVYGLGAGYLMALVVHSHQCHLEAHRGEAIEGLPTTEDKAREIAHGPIQGYIGPDHEVIDMKAFFAALVQALREAKRTSA